MRRSLFDPKISLRLLTAVGFVLGIAFGLVSTSGTGKGLAGETVSPTVPVRSETRKILIAAHRGANQFAPENTVAAIRKAVAMGADYVEIDVRQTKDGALVLLHNDTLDGKTDGTGPVTGKTLAEVKALSAGIKFSPEFADEKIPTLDEACIALVEANRDYGRSAAFYVDCKDPDFPQMLKILKKHGLLDSTIFLALDEDLIGIRKIAPQAKLLLAAPGAVLPEDRVESVRPFATNPARRLITPELVTDTHAAGLEIWTNTPNATAEELRNLIEMGVDVIETDQILNVQEAGWSAEHSFPVRSETRRILIAAHRGANQFAPENTVAAIRKAVAMGADYVEIDVRQTKDGALVLLHNDTLDGKTDGTGPVTAKTLAEVKALSAGIKFSPEFADEKIPTLDEACVALVEANRDYGCSAAFYVDCKDPIVSVMVESLRRHHLLDSAVFFGWDWTHAEIKKLAPNAKFLLGYTGVVVPKSRIETLAPVAMDLPWRLLSAETIAKVHEAGLQVWTDAPANATIEELREKIATGVDQIQTDRLGNLFEAERIDLKREEDGL